MREIQAITAEAFLPVSLTRRTVEQRTLMTIQQPAAVPWGHRESSERLWRETCSFITRFKGQSPKGTQNVQT